MISAKRGNRVIGKAGLCLRSKRRATKAPGKSAISNGQSVMLVLVSYDVSTVDAAGKRRLRRMAKACLDFGQRVQMSVFECQVDPAQWAALKQRLIDIMDPATDSLRFYYLGSNWERRVEHVGAKETVDLDGPLIA